MFPFGDLRFLLAHAVVAEAFSKARGWAAHFKWLNGGLNLIGACLCYNFLFLPLGVDSGRTVISLLDACLPGGLRPFSLTLVLWLHR